MNAESPNSESSNTGPNSEEHAMLQSLLGAYAVHALDDDETELVRAHLETCAQCRDELIELSDAAAAVALTAEHQPSPQVWSRLLEGMRADDSSQAGSANVAPEPMVVATSPAPTNVPTAPATNVVDLASARSKRISVRSALLGAVAAAAIAIPSTLAFTGSSTPSIAAMAKQAASQANAQVTELQDTEGKRVGEVVLTATGQGYFRDSSLPQLPEDKTYQLWAVIDGKPVSAGLLGAKPGVSAFNVSSQNVAALAVSVEPKGGVSAPTNAPIASAALI